MKKGKDEHTLKTEYTIVATGSKPSSISGVNCDKKDWRDVRIDLILWGEKEVTIERKNKIITIEYFI